MLEKKINCDKCGESYPPGWPHSCDASKFRSNDVLCGDYPFKKEWIKPSQYPPDFISNEVRQMSDQTTSATKGSKSAVERLVSDDAKELLNALSLMVDAGFEVPSEIDGDISCHYCGAFLSCGEKHSDDCAHKNARELILKLLDR